MWHQTLHVRTGATPVVLDITDRVSAALAGQGDGLVHVFLPHATAGLALIETRSGSEPDLLELLDRIAPQDAPYRHRHGAPGHGRDHVLPALISPALTLAVVDGRLQLGVWQSLVLVDTNVDNPDREVRLSFLRG